MALKAITESYFHPSLMWILHKCCLTSNGMLLTLPQLIRLGRK